MEIKASTLSVERTHQSISTDKASTTTAERMFLEDKKARQELNEDERRQLRVLKNRESAMRSLQKKKEYTESLAAEVTLLESELSGSVERVRQTAIAIREGAKRDEERKLRIVTRTLGTLEEIERQLQHDDSNND